MRSGEVETNIRSSSGAVTLTNRSSDQASANWCRCLRPRSLPCLLQLVQPAVRKPEAGCSPAAGLLMCLARSICTAYVLMTMEKIDVRRQSILRTRNPWGKWVSEPDLRIGICSFLRVGEENIRMVLLAVLLIIYLSLGAILFSMIERKQEAIERRTYLEKLERFKKLHCGVGFLGRPLNCSELDELLDLRGNMSATGLSEYKSSWDFFGSFYFVSTIVTTIGFGMTTPRTSIGKGLVIVYGFVGCSSSILFFNLFLERILTFLSYLFRIGRSAMRRRRRLGSLPSVQANEPVEKYDDEDERLYAADWRPNLYFFWVSLLLLSSTIITLSALLYMYAEEWSYLEAIYFCFVSFATIGFGDLISSQQVSEISSYKIYRILNFVVLFFGCCCIYSLFNVTSIVVRTALNRIISTLNCHCQALHHFSRTATGQRGKDSLRTLDSLTYVGANQGGPTAGGDGLLSLREFLDATQENLALVQDQLLFPQDQENRKTSVSASSVGPMAIVNEMLGGGEP
uniref:Potassium channel domain-containing protein n=1 Tax=Trichuris muris TaxID=70415 RepID=A0A5S6R2X7_TRIMR